LGWEGQWDCGGLGGAWESQGLPMVPLGLWDGKDNGTLVALVGHGNPKDFPWSAWDWDGKDSGTVVALVEHGSPKDFPWSPWHFEMGRTVQDCGSFGGTWEYGGLPMVPLGLWDGMRRTVGLWWPWWDMGIPRTSHGPLGTLGWEVQ